MTDEVALSDETLDELFVREVGSVTKIVEKLPSNAVMATCTRWFKIFQAADPEERFARNCMLLLLHKQLNDDNTLSFPFTDARSYQRDLKTLHQMSLTLHHADGSVDDVNKDDNRNGDANTEDSPTMDTSSPFSSHSPEVCCVENSLRLEIANKVLMEQNKEMLRELQELEAEKEKLLTHRENLEATNETLRDHNKLYSKEVGCMKHIFACSSLTALKLFSQPQFMERPNYFVTLFSVLCDDARDRAHFEQMDIKLGSLLRDHMDYYVSLTTRDQISRAYYEMHASVCKRYKQLIRMQEETAVHQLSLMTMRYLMTLRKLFLDTHKQDKGVEQLALDFIQYNYNDLAKGL
ncbi:uncharacterized protein LOC6572824 [Drosophila mojavensis]|uniref:Uncharacterized protein n=1 Tax=Drosophila mojavensis TaxID=7230 RepID=B4K8J2_DROMO|nr:uncharacterized protein LOC6572824 [Drosophila mojavensis]EDW14391.1 uncharacterized protein Dmoj_GI24233 [Drosophila mojavensis]